MISQLLYSTISSSCTKRYILQQKLDNRMCVVSLSSLIFLSFPWHLNPNLKIPTLESTLAMKWGEHESRGEYNPSNLQTLVCSMIRHASWETWENCPQDAGDYDWTVFLNCTPELYSWTVRLNCTTEHCYWTRNAFCLSSPQNSMELRLIILWCTHIFLLESFRAKVVA